MGLIFVCALALGLSALAIWSKNFILSVVSFGAWMVGFYITLVYPPYPLVIGSEQQIALLIVLCFAGAGVITYTAFANFRLTQDLPEEERPTTGRGRFAQFMDKGSVSPDLTKRSETAAMYARRVNTALNANHNSRRRK